MKFNAPNPDTLNDYKQLQANTELVNLLYGFNEPDAAEYLQSQLTDAEEKPDAHHPVNDRLLRVNEDILDVLSRIQRDMRDEQDTAIRREPKAGKELKAQTEISQGAQLMPQGAGFSAQDFFSDFLDDLDFDFDRDKDKEKERRRNRNDRRNQRRSGPKGPRRGGLIRNTLSKIGDLFKPTGVPDVPDVPKKPPKPLQTAPKPVSNAPKGPTTVGPKTPGKFDSLIEAVKGIDIKNPSMQELKTVSAGAKAIQKFAKISGPVAGIISIGTGVIDYVTAESSAERTQAITSNAAAAAGASLGTFVGAALGSVVPVAGTIVGAVVGGFAGESAGRALGEWIGGIISEPEDKIPDVVKSQGIDAEIAYIDNTLVPEITGNPELSEKEKTESLSSLERYKTDLRRNVERESTEKSKNLRARLTVERFEKTGIIDHNYIGNSEIKDWSKIEQASVTELENLITFDDWSPNDMNALQEILNRKKQSALNLSNKTPVQHLEDAKTAESAKLKAMAEGTPVKDTGQTTVGALDNAAESVEIPAASDSEQMKRNLAVVQNNLATIEAARQNLMTNSPKPPGQIRGLNARVPPVQSSGYAANIVSYVPSSVPTMSYAAGQQLSVGPRNAMPSAPAISNGPGTATVEAQSLVSSEHVGTMTAQSESRNDPGCISTGAHDKGGKSYGLFQLALNTGTLRKFVDRYAEQFPMLAKAPLASPEFDGAWKEYARTQTSEFSKAQHEFMQKTHYEPIFKLAESLGYPTENRAIQEALFSQSTQHSYKGNKKILETAKSSIQDMQDIDEVIDGIYTARQNYALQYADVGGHRGIINRYKHESKLCHDINASLQKKSEVESAEVVSTASAVDINPVSEQPALTVETASAEIPERETLPESESIAPVQAEVRNNTAEIQQDNLEENMAMSTAQIAQSVSSVSQQVNAVSAQVSQENKAEPEQNLAVNGMFNNSL